MPRIRTLLLLVVIGVLVAGAWNRNTVRAQWRAALVATEVGEQGSLASVTHALTAEPTTASVRIGDWPAFEALPGRGAGPWPTVVMLVPTDPSGAELEPARLAAIGLARGGVATWIVQVPGSISDAADQDVAERLRTLATDGRVRDGRIMLLGAYSEASLALRVAGREQLGAQVVAVGAVSPWTDLTTLISLVTTGAYVDPSGAVQRREVPAVLRRAAAVAMVDAAGASGRIPSDVLARLREQVEAADDPLQPIADLPTLVLPAEARAVVALAANDDPRRVAALVQALPDDARRQVAERSPAVTGAGLVAPAMIIADVDDRWIPASESERLVDAASRSDVDLLLLDLPGTEVGDPSMLDGGTLRDVNRAVVRLLRRLDEDPA